MKAFANTLCEIVKSAGDYRHQRKSVSTEAVWKAIDAAKQFLDRLQDIGAAVPEPCPKCGASIPYPFDMVLEGEGRAECRTCCKSLAFERRSADVDPRFQLEDKGSRRAAEILLTQALRRLTVSQILNDDVTPQEGALKIRLLDSIAGSQANRTILAEIIRNVREDWDAAAELLISASGSEAHAAFAVGEHLAAITQDAQLARTLSEIAVCLLTEDVSDALDCHEMLAPEARDKSREIAQVMWMELKQNPNSLGAQAVKLFLELSA